MDLLLTLRLFVVSDLFEGRFMEDSFEIGEAFYVIAEGPDGSRWRHHHTFSGEGVTGRRFAKMGADRLLSRIEQSIDYGKWAGPRANGHWAAIPPAYGSVAYSANWRALGALQELREGNFEPGTSREAELRELAAEVD
jgi:hypothetical protein